LIVSFFKSAFTKLSTLGASTNPFLVTALSSGVLALTFSTFLFLGEKFILLISFFSSLLRFPFFP